MTFDPVRGLEMGMTLLALALMPGEGRSDAQLPSSLPSPPAIATVTPSSPLHWRPPRSAEREAERAAMVREIQAYGLRDEKVLAAMRAVPRHRFVPATLASASSPVAAGGPWRRPALLSPH
ncbi:MAG: hypothetical protein ACYTGH_01185 [Planctomycetota bacterium]|jgi:protein-L-isoaspartate(D-aspartate) O-methyltransferase